MTAKCAFLIAVTMAAWSGAVLPDGDTSHPGRLVAIDLNAKPGGFSKDPKKQKDVPGQEAVAYQGDLIQYYAIWDVAKPDDSLRNFKVEITGDAMTLVAVVEVPVPRQGKPPSKFGGPPPVDIFKKSLSCFLKAAKEGNATVKITPIGEDGKDRPSYEVSYRVAKRPPPEPAKKRPATAEPK